MENNNNVTKEMVINGATKFIEQVEKLQFEQNKGTLNQLGQDMGNRGYNDYSLKVGKKYIKVVCNSLGSQCVHSFINMENGDILKANGWKAPSTKTSPRGNVLSKENGMESVDQRGTIKYLR